MKSSLRTHRPHPTSALLALYASKDVSVIAGWRTARHLAECPECRVVLSAVQTSQRHLRQASKAETLTGFEAITDWDELERKLLGNITVGIDAARCIPQRRRVHHYSWRVPILGCVLLLMFVAGWLFNVPREQSEHLSKSIRRIVGLESPRFVGSILQTTPGSLAARSQRGTLMMMHPPDAVISLRGRAVIEARYTDPSTGQIVITTVYGQ